MREALSITPSDPSVPFSDRITNVNTFDFWRFVAQGYIQASEGRNYHITHPVLRLMHLIISCNYCGASDPNAYDLGKSSCGLSLHMESVDRIGLIYL